MKKPFKYGGIAILVLTGCAKPLKSDLVVAPYPKLDSNWVSHDTRAALTVAAPNNWILSRSHISPLGVNLQDIQSAMADSSQNSTAEAPATPAPPPPEPDTVDPSDLEAQTAKGLVLVLYNKSVKPIPGEVTTRLSVLKDSASGTLDETAQKYAKEDNTTATQARLPIGPAEMYKAERTTRGGDVITDIVYVIVNGAESYKFTFETSNHESNVEQDADPIMQTVRLKS